MPSLTSTQEQQQNSVTDEPVVVSPTTEQEIPPIHSCNRSPLTDKLSPQTVEQLEREMQAKKAQQEINLKDNAFVLLCWCLGAFAFFVIFDTAVINFGGSTSEIMNTALDLGKTIVTFLIGFLFATEKPKK